MDRSEPARVRDVSHPDSLSRHTVVSSDGSGRTNTPSQLDPIRHGARRLSTAPYVTGGTRARLWLDLPASLLAHLDLASAPSGLAGCSSLFGDVLPIQTIERHLALAHSTRSGSRRLATVGRMDAET